MNDRTNTAITESISWNCPMCGKGFNMTNKDWIVKYEGSRFYEFPYCSKRCKLLNKLKDSK
jgi:endogenous inhibitor of DNA gyrase (YacG/DUF329 family)